jgi:L-2-hydroxycarboxylate dehydrogenase (NAD+)
VIPFSTTRGASNLGQLFLAVDPAMIGDDRFVERMEALCAELAAAPPTPDAAGPVLIPGQPEAAMEAEQRQNGIRLDVGRVEALTRLGERLGVPFPDTARSGATRSGATRSAAR